MKYKTNAKYIYSISTSNKNVWHSAPSFICYVFEFLTSIKRKALKQIIRYLTNYIRNKTIYSRNKIIYLLMSIKTISSLLQLIL